MFGCLPWYWSIQVCMNFWYLVDGRSATRMVVVPPLAAGWAPAGAVAAAPPAGFVAGAPAAVVDVGTAGADEHAPSTGKTAAAPRAAIIRRRENLRLVIVRCIEASSRSGF